MFFTLFCFGGARKLVLEKLFISDFIFKMLTPTCLELSQCDSTSVCIVSILTAKICHSRIS